MDYKACSQCGQVKSTDSYFRLGGKRPGRQAECKACHMDRQTKYRQKLRALRPQPTPEEIEAQKEASRKAQRQAKERYRHKNMEKSTAKARVYRAIKKGQLKRPSACSQCGASGPIDAHHPDYSKPLDVVFLCKPCHGRTWRKR